MAGKKAPNSGSKKEAKSSGSDDSSHKSRRKGNQWPWWLWACIAVGLLAVAGRVFMQDAPEKPSKPGKTAKEALSEKKTSKAKGNKKSDPTQRYLLHALRLQEMTTLASNLEVNGMLDSDAARELDKELTNIDDELAGLDDATSRDLRAMVSVVRGTLYQRGDKLSDEEVEKLTNSYTYANPRYWDDYYNKTSEAERFDWYGSWDSTIKQMTFQPQGGEAQSASTIGELMRPYFGKEANILMLGCGNSDMSEKMYTDGYENIMNVDISESLLDNLRTRLAASMPKMRWQFANCSALEFETGTFDVIIDKGTLDAIEANKGLLSAASKEAHRTLKPGGFFLSATFNDAPLRVDAQLRNGTTWGSCYSHPFERELRKGKTADTEKNVYHLHACQRPL